MNRKKLFLQGINCADCANKIEDAIKLIRGVKQANLNFSTASVSIELQSKEEDWKIILNKIKEIVNIHEPNVNIIENQEDTNQNHHNRRFPSKKVSIIIIGIILYAIAIILPLGFYIKLSFFILSYVLIGGEILLRAIRNILRGQIFDENFLMSIATLGAFAIGEYPEGVAVMLFYQIGEFFQDLAVDRSRKSIKELMDIRPDYANLIVAGEITQVQPERIAIGQTIIVKPGEKVPLDGKVLNGESLMDTSALTGEPIPRRVKKGDDVLSGFINSNGLITLLVTKTFGESTVSKILDLVENASSKKAPTEQFITKFSRYYTPMVVYAALALAVIPPLVLPGAEFSQWIYRALVFLVISCPCALVVSIPLGFFGGIGAASKNGILVKGGNYLEALNNIDMIVFDKTGTLTRGVFEVIKINPLGNITKEQLLEYSAYGEYYSNHPIATSILNKYNGKIEKNDITDYIEIPGYGVKATLMGCKEILLGNNKLMQRENIEYTEAVEVGTIIQVAIDKKYAGYLVIADKIKEDAKGAISSLKKLGIRKTIMLTGDNYKVAENIALNLELDEYYAQLLPHEKVEKLEMLEFEKSKGKKLAFVGDGINDAPVLARADIGIAMGALGSDAAIEAADVVLMTDEPSKIVKAIVVAKNTRRIVVQNIVFALTIKAFILILGTLGIATMWAAVFADVGVSLIAVLNSLRILKES